MGINDYEFWEMVAAKDAKKADEVRSYPSEEQQNWDTVELRRMNRLENWR